MTALATPRFLQDAPGTHRCAVPRCPQSIPTDLLMCPLHWGAVPRRLQAEVWRTWRGTASGPVEEFEDRWAAYLKARRAAINAATPLRIER